MLETRHLERIARIGGIACEACFDQDLPLVLIKEIEDLLDASGAVFYDMRGSHARPEFGESVYWRIDPSFGAAYAEYYHEADPCMHSLARDEAVPTLSLATTAKAVPSFEAYEASEYYHDFLRPQAIHSSIIFNVSDHTGLLGLFGFQRPVSRAPFDRTSELLIRSIAAPIAQALSRRRAEAPAPLLVSVNETPLTPRQIEVAALITRGLSNPEIAAELGVSLKTVEHHISKIYAQLGTPNRVSLAQKLSALLAPTPAIN